MTYSAAPLVYLHGLPGSPEELSLISDRAAKCFAPQCWKGALDPQIRAQYGATPVTLAGFSLGAFRALRFAAAQPERIRHLHLIAPAAPLDLGDFLGDMAGGPIFRMARHQPNLFRLVMRIQAFAARLAPGLLAAQVFAQAQGEDRALTAKSDFRRVWSKIAHQCLTEGGKAYQAEIMAYVTPWSSLLADVQVPVTIWYGSADNWTPPAMAEALITALPRPPEIRRLDGASHYSTLSAAMAQIMRPAGLAQADQSALS